MRYHNLGKLHLQSKLLVGALINMACELKITSGYKKILLQKIALTILVTKIDLHLKSLNYNEFMST